MNAIQRFFFNISLFCFGIGLLFFVKLDCYASNAITVEWWNGVLGTSPNASKFQFIFSPSDNVRYGAYVYYNNFNYSKPLGGMVLYTMSPEVVSGTLYSWTYDMNGNQTSYNGGVSYSYTPLYNQADNIYFIQYSNNSFSCSSFLSTDKNDVLNYVRTGILPEIPFDETLELDYFIVSPYGIWDYLTTTPQDTLSFDYKYDIGWSDSRISKVQLKIDSTLSTQTFESSFSPFKGGFKGSTYAQTDGDVVRLIATPYKADGSYGVSLYYSFTQKNNSPLVNIWRKLFKNNHTDNTLTIPYNDTSVTQPVEGVGTVNNYKVNYNPVTNEYGDLNLYEIYYQPVVVYQPDTPQEEIDDTQEFVNNTYVTNNYYETTKNINLGFDINFGDISTNDITDTFDNFGNFGNGFGSFINRLASWLQLLFPFLHPAVAASIVFVFGLIVSLAIIALVLKIAGVIADIIPL